MQKSKKIITILGIDPGIATTGYGIIQKHKSQLTYQKHNTIETKPNIPFPKRLLVIHKELKKIVSKHKPDIVAVEKLYFYKNVKTALQVGEARGVIILTVMQQKMPLYEYTPLQIKQAITGYGKAEKHQIQQMVKTLLKLKRIPKPDDAADALAIAICCAHSIQP